MANSHEVNTARGTNGESLQSRGIVHEEAQLRLQHDGQLLYRSERVCGLKLTTTPQRVRLLTEDCCTSSDVQEVHVDTLVFVLFGWRCIPPKKEQDLRTTSLFVYDILDKVVTSFFVEPRGDHPPFITPLAVPVTWMEGADAFMAAMHDAQQTHKILKRYYEGNIHLATVLCAREILAHIVSTYRTTNLQARLPHLQGSERFLNALVASSAALGSVQAWLSRNVQASPFIEV